MTRTSRTLACIAFAALFCSTASALDVGQQAPNFNFLQTWNMPKGKAGLSDFRGSVVLLECWATWCPPCRKVVPHMNEIYSVYAPQGLSIISVSDEESNTIANFMRDHGMDYPVARANGVLKMYGRSTIPSAWLIDANGTVMWEGHPGSLTSGEIANALNRGQGAAVPAPANPGGVEDSNWWIWLIVLPAILFVGAMGWFVWSTRDKTSKTAMTSWYQQPQGAPQGGQPYPPQQGPPQAQGYPPPQPGYPPSVPVPQQQPPQQQPPVQYGGYAGSPPVMDQSPNTRGPSRYGPDGAMESPGAYHKPPPPPIEERPFLGGQGQQPAAESGKLPPYDTNQNRPGNPYR